jgi:hypothetical protein
MSAEAVGAAKSAVTSAIRTAARATGVNFNYLLATAKVESNLDPNLTVRTSSATGLFQFIEQTWLATLKQAGPAFGYSDYAAAIVRTADGRYHVANPMVRREIMQLRKDPTANSLMGAAVTQLNEAQLAKRIGRTPSEGELYIGHFFGPYAGAKAINLAASNPTANASEIFPAPAAANRSIFYDRQGNARSIAGVCAELVRRYGVARAKVLEQPSQPVRLAAAPAMEIAAAPLRPPAPIPRVATHAAAPALAKLNDLMFSPAPLPTTMAFASETAHTVPPERVQAARNEPNGGVFRSLFHAGPRDEPVSPVVAGFWTQPQTGTTAQRGTDAPATTPNPIAAAGRGTLLDLFRDVSAPAARKRYDGSA